ncbi:retrovirus-related pol polyprotein from transposon TNT 1-94 [Tanacetum coccineum]
MYRAQSPREDKPGPFRNLRQKGINIPSPHLVKGEGFHCCKCKPPTLFSLIYYSSLIFFLSFFFGSHHQGWFGDYWSLIVVYWIIVYRITCGATVRTDKGTEFLNKSLLAYFAKEGIRHETSTARTPEQNGVVERQNRTLVEAARTMLSAAKVPLFFWAEAIETACFTQNRSLVIPRHEKTHYHIINARKPSVKFFHIFGSLCYIVRDGENVDKMKEKGDACIFVGYSTQSKAYRVFNMRTRMIVLKIDLAHLGYHNHDPAE